MRPDYDMYPLESRSPWKTICLVALLVLLVCSVGLNVYLYRERAAATEQVQTLGYKITGLEEKLGASDERANYYKEELSKQQELIDLVDECVVFVEDDGTNLYHTFDCYRFDMDNFLVFNVEYAEAEGYSPCEKCATPSAKFDKEFFDLIEDDLNPHK